MLQLPAACGRAQRLATLQSRQAPAPSAVSASQGTRAQRALPAPCSGNSGSKQPIKPSCTQRSGGKRSSYSGHAGSHPTAVHTHLCGRCGTQGAQSRQHLLPAALLGLLQLLGSVDSTLPLARWEQPVWDTQLKEPPAHRGPLRASSKA